MSKKTKVRVCTLPPDINVATVQRFFQWLAGFTPKRREEVLAACVKQGEHLKAISNK
jgi:hypothetical protein